MKIPGPDRWLYRFLAGQPMDGRYRTDASFWRRGRKLMHAVPVRRWSYLAGWQRLTIRLAVTFGIPFGYWAYKFHRLETVATLTVGCLSATLYAVLRARRAWRRRTMHRRYVAPLHAVVAPMLGLPPTQRAADYITVPPTYREREDTPALIRLPKSFAPTPGNRQQLTDAVLPKLGLNEDNTDVIYHTVGNPVMECKMAPQPPDLVPWAEHEQRMLELPAGKTFVGLGARNKPFVHDWTSGELVHVGVSVGTGGGKSFGVVGWVAQELRKGASATYVDPKQSSLPEVLLGTPGYRLANDPDNPLEWWEEIFRYEREMDRRRDIMRRDRTAEFPLMFLVVDELSEFADVSRQMWEAIKAEPERYGYENVPKKAPVPVWRSISRILRMGREFGCRCILLTQRLDNASTGGIGLRDNLGMRALGKFRRNQWMMLVGTTPIPKSVNKVGRWIYTDGDKDLWVQNVYGTAEQLRDWARAMDTRVGQEAGDDVSSGNSPAGVQWDVVGNQAAADHLGIPLETFRKRRRTHGPIVGEGLSGRSPAWTAADLDKWSAELKQDT